MDMAGSPSGGPRGGPSCLSTPGALGLPGLVAVSLQPLPLSSRGLSLRLCILPVSYEDTLVDRGHLVQCDFILTNTVYKDPIFKSGHNLGSRWTHPLGDTLSLPPLRK